MKYIHNITEIRKNVKRHAQEIGLPIFGVASPEPLNHLFNLLHTRKERGLESPFESKWKTEERCRPDLLLPSVKSIICVGMPYPDYDASCPLWGISRFAWGRDYHSVLKDKLGTLAVFLRDQIGDGLEYVATVDSVPLPERALAYRAGLGWYGKNNLLINSRYGSWFFLGELLTNIPFEPDTSEEGSCGDCDLCLQACPTGALTGPYQLDAGKCISCLTQVKKTVPLDLREKVGMWIFGCDICQKICPYNRKNVKGNSDKSLKHEDFPGEALAALFDISETDFRREYGTTAFAWGGRERLQANAALALGSKGRERYVPALGKALTQLSPQVRIYAAWALGRIGSSEADRLLAQALIEEKDSRVRQEITQAMIRHDSAVCVKLSK